MRLKQKKNFGEQTRQNIKRSYSDTKLIDFTNFTSFEKWSPILP